MYSVTEKSNIAEHVVIEIAALDTISNFEFWFGSDVNFCYFVNVAFSLTE
jgi:hypothetical protein